MMKDGQKMKKVDLNQDEKMKDGQLMGAKKMRGDGWMDAMSYRVAFDHPFSFSSI